MRRLFRQQHEFGCRDMATAVVSLRFQQSDKQARFLLNDLKLPALTGA